MNEMTNEQLMEEFASLHYEEWYFGLDEIEEQRFEQVRTEMLRRMSH